VCRTSGGRRFDVYESETFEDLEASGGPDDDADRLVDIRDGDIADSTRIAFERFFDRLTPRALGAHHMSAEDADV